MEENNALQAFFERSFEKPINEKMMYYSYSIESDLVTNFILSIVGIPLSTFLDYMRENYNVSYLESKDVVQFSDLNDCTTNICKKIKLNGDNGVNAFEIGQLLEDDGKERKNGALIKYGENHAKTATNLGLLQCIENKFFLSCFGYVYDELNGDNKNAFLMRLILRNKLIWRLLYKAMIKGGSNYYFETGFLSKSTQLRRKANVKSLFDVLKQSCDAQMNSVLRLIEF